MSTSNISSTTNYINYLNNLTNSINLYFGLIGVPAGVFFNMIVILVFSRRKLRESSTMSLFYIALAIYDSLVLAQSIIFVAPLPAYGIKLFNVSDAACKVLYLIRRTIGVCSSWVQAMITFDRYQKVVCPQKYKFIDDRFKLNVMFVAWFFIFLVINMTHMAYYTVQVGSTTERIFDSALNKTVNVTWPKLSCTSSYAMLFYTDIMVIMLRSVIPYAIMFTLDIFTIKKLLESRKNAALKRSLKKEMSFTRTVIFMDVIFFILYIPWSAWYVVYRISGSLSSFQSPLITAYINYAQSIVYPIAYINNFDSFFLNLAFNNIFRRELLSLVPGVWKIEPSTVVTATDGSKRRVQPSKVSKTNELKAAELKIDNEQNKNI